MSLPRYSYEKEYRNTRYGGLTRNIAICLECKKVIKPSRVRISKSGTHGTEYYIHEHPLIFVELYQSNSGNRSIVIPEEFSKEFSEMERYLKTMWIYEGCSVNEVIDYISKFLTAKLVADSLLKSIGGE